MNMCTLPVMSTMAFLLAMELVGTYFPEFSCSIQGWALEVFGETVIVVILMLVASLCAKGTKSGERAQLIWALFYNGYARVLATLNRGSKGWSRDSAQSYKTLILNQTQNHNVREAERHFRDAQSKRIPLSADCYQAMVTACLEANEIVRAEYWIDQMITLKHPQDAAFTTSTGVILVRQSLRSNQVKKAQEWVSWVEDWTTGAIEPSIYLLMIDWCARMGKWEEAQQWTNRMEEKADQNKRRTHVAFLQACAKLGSGKEAKARARLMEAEGFPLCPETNGFRIIAWMRGGDWEKAAEVLSEPGELAADGHMFSIAVQAALKGDNWKHAQRWLDEAERRGFKCHDQVYTGMVHYFATHGDPAKAHSWLLRMEKAKEMVDRFTFNAVLSAYSRNGAAKTAAELLEHFESSERKSDTVDLVSYNTVIDAFAKIGDVLGAERWYEALLKSDFAPDVISHNALINACARASDVKGAERWLQKALDSGLSPDIVSYNSVINACVWSGDLNSAKRWVTHMEEATNVMPDVVTYSSMIDAWAKAGDVFGAAEWLGRMEAKGMKANVVSYTSLLNAFAKAGDVPGAERLLESMIQRGLRVDTVSYTAVMNGCARAIDPEGAVKWMNRMLEAGVPANAFSYNSVINAYSRAGNLEQAEAWYRRMLASDVEVTVVSCTSLLTACGHDKVVDGKGHADRIFREMMSKGVLKPNFITLRTLERSMGAAHRDELCRELGIDVESILSAENEAASEANFRRHNKRRDGGVISQKVNPNRHTHKNRPLQRPLQ